MNEREKKIKSVKRTRISKFACSFPTITYIYASSLQTVNEELNQNISAYIELVVEN